MNRKRNHFQKLWEWINPFIYSLKVKLCLVPSKYKKDFSYATKWVHKHFALTLFFNHPDFSFSHKKRSKRGGVGGFPFVASHISYLYSKEGLFWRKYLRNWFKRRQQCHECGHFGQGKFAFTRVTSLIVLYFSVMSPKRNVVCQLHIPSTIHLHLDCTWFSDPNLERSKFVTLVAEKWLNSWIICLCSSFPIFHIKSILLFYQVSLCASCEVYLSSIDSASLSLDEINNMRNAHLLSHFDKVGGLEAEVKHLTQWMNEVMNQMSSPKLSDPTTLVPSSHVLNPNPKVEPMTPAQKAGDDKNRKWPWKRLNRR